MGRSQPDVLGSDVLLALLGDRLQRLDEHVGRHVAGADTGIDRGVRLDRGLRNGVDEGAPIMGGVIAFGGRRVGDVELARGVVIDTWLNTASYA